MKLIKYLLQHLEVLFLNKKRKKLKNIKPKHAIRHPKWKMGKKISIDSATMVNKLFELIETNKIFNIILKKLKFFHTQILMYMQL